MLINHNVTKGISKLLHYGQLLTEVYRTRHPPPIGVDDSIAGLVFVVSYPT